MMAVAVWKLAQAGGTKVHSMRLDGHEGHSSGVKTKARQRHRVGSPGMGKYDLRVNTYQQSKPGNACSGWNSSMKGRY